MVVKVCLGLGIKFKLKKNLSNNPYYNLKKTWLSGKIYMFKDNNIYVRVGLEREDSVKFSYFKINAEDYNIKVMPSSLYALKKKYEDKLNKESEDTNGIHI